MIAALAASGAVGFGLALMAWSAAARRRSAQLARLVRGDEPQPARRSHEDDRHTVVVEAAVGFAGKVVDRVDRRGGLAEAIAQARLPMRPGEYLAVSAAAATALAALLTAVTRAWVFGAVGLAAAAGGSAGFLRSRVKRRRKRLEAQLPDALSVVASSLAAGHTFLRAVQMLGEEAEPPLSEELARVVSETRLGGSLVDALERMASRLRLRDLDWVVQAIRIQQTVGGRLADLLHTLADFIRARDELRREVSVLTAEGRISAWVLGGLAPFLAVVIQVMNPGYLAPMLRGWGLALLAASAVSVSVGVALIFRMANIEV